MKRFVSLYFPHLQANWIHRKDPDLSETPFVLTITQNGKKIICASNSHAAGFGNLLGMSLGDARAFIPGLKDFEEKPGLCRKLLLSLARWCGRFSPAIALEAPDGLLLDSSGCSHLWGSEEIYLNKIVRKLSEMGFYAKAGMAGTHLSAWAICRFGRTAIIPEGEDLNMLLCLPPAALKLEQTVLERCQKLGLSNIGHFLQIHRNGLRRRFGTELVIKLEIISGKKEEHFNPVFFPEPYEERLPCMEPIKTAIGIEIAIDRLLEMMCKRLASEQKGLRSAVLKCFRLDGLCVQISIGTHAPSKDPEHLGRLLKNKVFELEPGLGIEVFVLQAPKIEELLDGQEVIWANEGSQLKKTAVASMMDRIESKLGKDHLFRYLPEEQYWPEMAFRRANSLEERPQTVWFKSAQRPLHLFEKPEFVEVSAPIPDYPPILFIYKGKVHHINKSDGPERICAPWWIHNSQARDYFKVEDQEGARYWIFRLGYFEQDKKPQWFLHGIFP